MLGALSGEEEATAQKVLMVFTTHSHSVSVIEALANSVDTCHEFVSQKYQGHMQ